MRNAPLILGFALCLIGGGAWLTSLDAKDVAPSGYDLLNLPDKPAPLPLPKPGTPAVSVCVNGQCSLVQPDSEGTVAVSVGTASAQSVRLVVAPRMAARYGAPVGRPLLRIVTAPRRLLQGIRARRAARRGW